MEHNGKPYGMANGCRPLAEFAHDVERGLALPRAAGHLLERVVRGGVPAILLKIEASEIGEEIAGFLREMGAERQTGTEEQ